MSRLDDEFLVNNMVIDFLKSKDFKNSSILQEVSISVDSRKRIYADIILINEETKDYLAVIEIKRLLTTENIHKAKQQIHSYLQVLQRHNLAGYIIGLDENNEITIYSIDQDGKWEKLSIENFPNYDSLSATEEKKRELSKNIKKKKNVDIFMWICIAAAIISCTLLVLSILDIIKLDDKEMSLFLLSIVLVIVPFVAKLEILGIVFERKVEK
jgi:hypothetical protein